MAVVGWGRLGSWQRRRRFRGRRGHEAFSDGDNLWVVAGVTVDSSGDDVGYDDTWQSPDGGTWVLYDSGAVFGARLGHQAFWFDGRPWVVGGFDPADGSSGADNGIWHEDDSGSWVAVTPSGEVFSARFRTSGGGGAGGWGRIFVMMRRWSRWRRGC